MLPGFPADPFQVWYLFTDCGGLHEDSKHSIGSLPGLCSVSNHSAVGSVHCLHFSTPKPCCRSTLTQYRWTFSWTYWALHAQLWPKGQTAINPTYVNGYAFEPLPKTISLPTCIDGLWYETCHLHEDIALPLISRMLLKCRASTTQPSTS